MCILQWKVQSPNPTRSHADIKYEEFTLIYLLSSALADEISFDGNAF